MIEKLCELGLEFDIWEFFFFKMKDYFYFVLFCISFLDSLNIVVILKGSGDGKFMILNGYIDVVLEGDVN